MIIVTFLLQQIKTQKDYDLTRIKIVFLMQVVKIVKIFQTLEKQKLKIPSIMIIHSLTINVNDSLILSIKRIKIQTTSQSQ